MATTRSGELAALRDLLDSLPTESVEYARDRLARRARRMALLDSQRMVCGRTFLEGVAMAVTHGGTIAQFPPRAPLPRSAAWRGYA